MNKRKIMPFNQYVMDLGADFYVVPPKKHKRHVWKLVAIVVLVVLAALFLRHAISSRCQIDMVVKLNDNVIRDGETYSVSAGDQILVTAESTVSSINRIGYYSNLNMEIRDTYQDTVTITVPDLPEGTKVQLFIEAVADNDDGTANTITKTGWKKFILVYP